MPDDAESLGDNGSQLPPQSSLYCNALTQPAFKPFDFDERGMNLHMQESASDRRVLVFIHGFNGHGYSTWGDFPKILFDDRLPGIDIGIFRYNTGFVAAAVRSVHMHPTIERLLAVMQDLAQHYSSITLVCHSLGGIIAQTAVTKFLTDHVIASSTGYAKIASIFLFGSPRAGTWLAPAILDRVFREFKYLSRFADNLTDVDKFFTKHVETELAATPGDKRFLIPRFVCLGDGDNVAEEFGATYGVADERLYYPNLNHREIAKPNSNDSPQIKWVCDGVKVVEDLRRQWLREDLFRSSQDGSASVAPINYVTELWSGSFGVRGKLILDQVRQEYAGVTSITGRPIIIHDRLEIPDAVFPVDLLVSLHDASRVIDGSEAEKPAIYEARNRKLAAERLTVGIATVGEEAVAAKEKVDSWLMASRPFRQFYTEPAEEESALRVLLGDWLRSIIGNGTSSLPAGGDNET